MKQNVLVIIAILLGLSMGFAGCRKKTSPAPKANAESQNQDIESPAQTAAPRPVIEPQANSGNETQGKESDTISGAIVWTTDYEAAKTKAALEGKDLFIDFSGSDWCGWCKRLDKEVFSQKLFALEAPKHFVFVLLDFPRDKSGQSSHLQEQNSQLAETYRVDSFPTIILADSTGKPYAKTGYRDGGPMAYIQHLAELRAGKQSR